MRIAPLLFAIGLSSPIFSQEFRPTTPAVVKAREPGAPQSLTLVVTTGGFSSPAGTYDQGTYAITIINRTGDRSLQVQFDRVSDNKADVTKTQESGKAAAGTTPETNKLAAGATDISRGRFQTIQKLEPGTYKLWAVNFPRWTYTLTVK